MMKNPKIEALKEVARWVVFFVISWIVTSMLAQINLVPESQEIKAWVFTFSIPVRQMFLIGLTLVQRFADKYRYVTTKQDFSIKTQGLLPF
jgi:hypothetical protein